MVDIIDKALRMGEGHQLKKLENVAKAVNALEDEISALSDEDLKAQTPKFKQEIENGKSLDEIMPEAFATVREVSKRTLGQRHFDVQLMGGAALHWGNIAEMKTGEGKTLVATLPTYLNALEGKGVHVVTVNDYLASYQSELMGRIYRFLGMNVGCIITEQKPPERRKQYNADITYGTNNEFGFDYLRDNMAWEKADLVQRGHHYAIVDEVDSILIDEARTPLIISGPAEGDVTRWYRQFAKLVLKLTRDEDYDVDEKKKVVGILDPGITKVEDFLGIDNLYEPANTALIGYLNNAIKAKELFLRDKDYVVTQGEVLIVDEHTGRILPGRRYNEGLHQAIEAKEGVKVAQESKTLATITFQNYFRLYTKLSGMTGTAMTEEDEFREIYKLDVIAIPTNRPVQRIDHTDLIYRTEKGKYKAIIEQIAECHEKGQPVLVGTISIEKSELLSSMLKRKGIKHEVLNAKYHAKEAEIVAQAGKLGAVTIATNMAGRGTDIMLGGNAEYMAKAQMRKEHFCENLLNPEKPEDADPNAVELLLTEADGHGDTTDENILAARRRFEELYAQYKPAIEAEADEVRKAGGLFIIGTERHESRRIDNQLRGRAGRQGDPGASRFYLSLEDDLMRLFGGDRVSSLMDTLKLDEDTPIENRMITSTLESAQKKLEGRNFEIRKNVLKYDDVMNQQREIIYGQRRKVLDGEDISTEMHNMLRENIDSSCKQFLAGDVKDEWDFGALRRHYQGWLTTDADFHYTVADYDSLSVQGIADLLYDRGMDILNDKEQRYGPQLMRELERICLLKCVDRQWMDHIDNMDQLRQGIALRGYGQKDPVVEYRIEGFDMFDQMVDSIRESSIKMLLTIEVRGAGTAAPKREQVAKPTGEGFVPGNGAPGAKGAPKGQPIRVIKIGRNDPCPCGSGLKWKKCTCAQYHPNGSDGGEQ